MFLRLKDDIYQIEALVIKEFKLKTRFKVKFIVSIITPVLAFIIPFLIFRKIFQAVGDASFGIWTPHNYIIFLLTGIFVSLILQLVPAFGSMFLSEKYWKTLQGFFMAPVKTSQFLISKLIAELIILAVPLMIVFVSCFLIAGFSLISIFFIFLLFFSSCILISSIGLAIGSFRISKEGNFTLYMTILQFFFIFSCYKYPMEFFPEYLDFLIIFNPFYYFWDLIRYIILYDVSYVLFNPDFIVHFIVVISFTILAPILSIYFFNYVFKKYGITGY